MNSLRTHVLVLALSLITLRPGPSRAQMFGVGLNINQSQFDYGLGLNLTSPMIASSFRFRLTGNVLGLTGVRGTSPHTETFGYEQVRLGVVGKPIVLSPEARVYWEGGPLALFNNRLVTSKKINIGGYGIMGMEYRPSDWAWVYLEGGGIGTGAQADLLAGSPSYATGLIFGMGFRVYL